MADALLILIEFKKLINFSLFNKTLRGMKNYFRVWVRRFQRFHSKFNSPLDVKIEHVLDRCKIRFNLIYFSHKISLFVLKWI
jgi:hypothetical protein